MITSNLGQPRYDIYSNIIKMRTVEQEVRLLPFERVTLDIIVKDVNSTNLYVIEPEGHLTFDAIYFKGTPPSSLVVYNSSDKDITITKDTVLGLVREV